MTRGKFNFKSAGGIVAFNWKDSKGVHFISNYYGTETTTLWRKNKSGQNITYPCLEVGKDYNSFMGGDYKRYMLRKLYGSNRKWRHGIFLVNRCNLSAQKFANQLYAIIRRISTN